MTVYDEISLFQIKNNTEKINIARLWGFGYFNNDRTSLQMFNRLFWHITSYVFCLSIYLAIIVLVNLFSNVYRIPPLLMWTVVNETPYGTRNNFFNP